MRERQSDMLQGSVVKPILLFFFPILFGSLFQQLYNTVDAMVVGNFVGNYVGYSKNNRTRHTFPQRQWFHP